MLLSEDNLASEYTLDILDKLYAKLNSKTNVKWMFILDENGITQSSITPKESSVSTTNTDVSYREYFINTKTSLKPYFTNGLIGINDIPIIITTYPILNSNNEFKGLIAASLVIDDFFSMYGNISDPNSTFLIVIGNDKKFITHPDSKQIGKYAFDDEFFLNNGSKEIEQVQKLFLENNTNDMYEFQNQEKIIHGDSLIVNDNVQYFIFMTTPIDSISQQTSDVFQKEKYSTYLIMIFLILASGVVVIFFEKFKMKEQEERETKLISIGELSARLAHDIRNPLSVISMTIDNIRNAYTDNSKMNPHFDKIERAIDRITHQINGVLNYVRENPITFEKISILQIITNSIDSIKIPDEIKLIIPKNDIEFRCDKEQLQIVISNLILNGIQAIIGQGVIIVTLRETNKKIIIEIEDSGKGIHKNDLSHVFEPMFTTKQQGTGLGLVSCKSIITAHKGTISVKSPPTIFTITLPKTNS
jgi:signal transduction histidine kinase